MQLIIEWIGSVTIEFFFSSPPLPPKKMLIHQEKKKKSCGNRMSLTKLFSSDQWRRMVERQKFLLSSPWKRVQVKKMYSPPPQYIKAIKAAEPMYFTKTTTLGFLSSGPQMLCQDTTAFRFWMKRSLKFSFFLFPHFFFLISREWQLKWPHNRRGLQWCCWEVYVGRLSTCKLLRLGGGTCI